MTQCDGLWIVEYYAPTKGAFPSNLNHERRLIPLAASLRLGNPGRMDRAKRVLAVETSGRHGSIAAMRGDGPAVELIAQSSLAGDERTAQALAPALKRLLADVGWAPSCIDLVAVAVGPGSFTGLRIGVTTAKAFAYATSAELVGVNTLEALALQASPSTTPLWTILDAQRQELFVAKFVAGESSDLHIASKMVIMPQGVWLSELKPGDRVIGPALSRVLANLPSGVLIEPETSWQPMAEAIGKAGWADYRAGRRDDIWQLVPNYYRLSAAEEKAR